MPVAARPTHSPRPTDTRQRRKEKARAEVARVTVRLFAEKGYEATTVEEIAGAADMSPSTFHRYFRGKDDVLFFDLPDRLEELEAIMADPSEDLWTTVKDAVLGFAEGFYDEEPEFALARVRLWHAEPALHARYLTICQGWEDSIAAAFASARGNTPDTDLEARLMGAAVLSAFKAAFRIELASDTRLADLVAVSFAVHEAGLGSRLLP